MRIIFDPIVVNPDGISVNRDGDHRGPLFYLDPKKFSSQGIREAAEYANLDRANAWLRSFRDADPDRAEDHMVTEVISPPMRQQYREQVASFGGMGATAKRQIAAFLQARLDNAKEHPDEVLAQLKQSIDAPPTEWELITRKPPRLEETKRAYRIKLDKAIDALPEHLRMAMEQEKMTLVCAEKISNLFPVQAGVCMHDSNSIGFVYSYLQNKPLAGLVIALKEEVLHYFEQKQGITDSEPWQKAAKALLADDAKMAAIEKAGDEVHGEFGKITVRQYDKHQQPGELFAEYFHIRDHLAAKAGRNGEAKANAEVEKLFGKELHEICQQFEAGLKEKASAISAGHRL